MGRRELARPGMQGRQGIRVSWMWRGGAGAPRVPWRASLEAGDAGQSKQTRHSGNSENARMFGRALKFVAP